MKKIRQLLVLMISISALMVSCDKEKDKPPVNTSRTIKYEFSGNFTGTLFASYTTATGGTANEQIPALPWSKEITYNANVTAAIIAASGNAGVQGQQINIVVKRGGAILTTTPVTANSAGGFSQTSPVVVF